MLPPPPSFQLPASSTPTLVQWCPPPFLIVDCGRGVLGGRGSAPCCVEPTASSSPYFQTFHLDWKKISFCSELCSSDGSRWLSGEPDYARTCLRHWLSWMGRLSRQRTVHTRESELSPEILLKLWLSERVVGTFVRHFWLVNTKGLA